MGICLATGYIKKIFVAFPRITPRKQLNYQHRLLRAFVRSYNLNPVESYSDVKPAIHIGLLDFTLFPEFPEFYAAYRMMNVKNHTVYSDKLCLSVVDLTHINLATEEDKLYHLNFVSMVFLVKHRFMQA